MIFFNPISLRYLLSKKILLKDPRFFFIVAQGTVEVQALLPTIRKKTSNLREYLCKKHKGDMVYAPIMRKLITASNAKELFEREDKEHIQHHEHKKNLIDLVDTVTMVSIMDSIILQLDWSLFEKKFTNCVRPPQSNLELSMLKAMMETNLNDYLEKLPILADLPNSKLEIIVRMCQYSVKKKGSIICKEGDLGTTVFILLSGEVKVEACASKRMVELLGDSFLSGKKESRTVSFKDDVEIEDEKRKGISKSQKTLYHRRKTLFEAGRDLRREMVKAISSPAKFESTKEVDRNHSVELSRLGPGDFFGEMATLIDLPRAATVTATTNTLLISLSKVDFKALLVAISPHLEHDFERMVKLHMLQNLFQLKSPFLNQIATEKINAMAEMTKIKKIPPNSDIFKEGDESNAFYFVYSGSATVRKKINGELREIGYLFPGDYFGELALINKTRRLATITTMSRSVVLEIAREDFHYCFQDKPELIAEFIVRMRGKKVDLKSILDHPKSKQVFQDFLDDEHGIENLLFYDAADIYHRHFDSLSQQEVRNKATKIIHLYLTESSENAVNVTSKMYTDAKNLLISLHFSKDSFVKPQHEIFKLMERDLFQRFRKSYSFSKLMARVRAYDELDVQLLS